MISKNNHLSSEFYTHFKAFYEMMSFKIQEILLVSSPYDAFIIEEDESLASRIINEYSGLNLSLPPRITRTSSASDALSWLEKKKFDMVITMPHLDGMDAFSLSLEIKKINEDMPVILLGHSPKGIYPLPENKDCSGIDDIFIWSGNSDLLMALVKNAEDRLNTEHDTHKARVRIMILVEDSPIYRSSFLPLLYKEIVKQTQKVLGEGLNEEHRLLKMRARPKILLAETYEEAIALYEKYHSFLFGVIADTRFPKHGKMQEDAGVILLSRIKKDIPDLPLLLMSSEPKNRDHAARIPAMFLDKNSRNSLADVIHNFFMDHLGFGDFVFRKPDGTEICRAVSLRDLQEKLPHIPEESLWYHAKRNHFSRWIMGRSEIILASTFREVDASEFSTADEMRQYLISNIRNLRKFRQKGVIARFAAHNFDSDIMDFVKIGKGSLGGKARGLAFMSALLQQGLEVYEKYPDVNIKIPKTLVIATDGFQSFVVYNHLQHFADEGFTDEEITQGFLNAEMPRWLVRNIEVFLSQVTYPLSIRSSSLLEDAQFQPYAGLYETYMIPNNHPDPSMRLEHLLAAIKLVYASTYYENPKAFSRNVSNKPQQESMGVIIQELAGTTYGDYFYPMISGVAQSHNFYPISHMKPEDGIAHIALGLGKTVVEGERTLRFSPKYPNILLQFSVVDDILKNSQRYFYALKMNDYSGHLNFRKYSTLEKREVDEAEHEFPIQMLASTYVPDEHRIRDSSTIPGPKILTFAQVLKYKIFPLPELLTDLLELGRKGMGCPVEIEFSVDLSPKGKEQRNEFFFLQMRPMVADDARLEVQICQQEIDNAFCCSMQALGNGKSNNISDIVYVKPEAFKAEATMQMAEEIGQINASLVKEKRPYLLAGPGRWGSSDRWLGIPVQWRHISGVSAMIELRNKNLSADPSQGSHFFQNITSLGIHYVTLTEGSDDYLDWEWLESIPTFQETMFIRHVRMDKPFTLKIDGKKAQCVMICDE